MEPIGARDPYALKAQILGQGAHAASVDSGKMDAAASVPVDRDRRRIDIYERAFLHRIEQTDNVMIAHAHAPVRQGSAHQVLPARAVDIDVALIRIHARALVDSLLKAFEPQNARQDQVVSVLFVIPVFARVLSVPENTARRRTCPVLLLDPMDTEWCFERVLSVAIAEAGGRAIVSLDDAVILADEKCLRLDGDHEVKLVRVGQEFLQFFVYTT